MKVTFLAALAVGFALLFGGTAMAHGGPAAPSTPRRTRRRATPCTASIADLTVPYAGRHVPHRRHRTGASLSSQGAVALATTAASLVAVNAGSNDISSFRVGRRGHLTRVDRVPSGGVAAELGRHRRGSVYVLNAAGDAERDRVRRRRLRRAPSARLGRADGGLDRRRAGVRHARRPRAGRDGPRSNRIETFPLRFGRPGTPIVRASAAPCRSGSRSLQRGDLIVSEAGASTVSSYRLGRDGTASVITSALGVGQGAACWVVVSLTVASRTPATPPAASRASRSAATARCGP